MGDYAIRMQFDIDADPGTVRNALTQADGIASWWSSHVGGNPEVDGGRLEVSFPEVPVPFDFSVAISGDNLEWTVGKIPEPWHGTAVRWQLLADPDAAGTRLRFEHGGFDPESPVIDEVTPAWALIISRLKAYAESGSAQPFFDF